MQLTLELETAPLLPRLRRALLALFGPQRAEGRLDPVSQLIKSIIGARTSDADGWAAFARLRGAFADWTDLASAAPKRIETAIAAAAFADRKARQLPILVRVIQIRTGGLDLGFLADGPVADAMGWLQSLPGVGCKSAAAVLNFSTLNRPALVVDSHVHRVAKRLGLAGRASDPAQAFEALTALIPATWTAEDLFELHWLIKGLGRSICSEASPRCGMCPLKAECPRLGVGVGRKVVELAAARRTREASAEAPDRLP